MMTLSNTSRIMKTTQTIQINEINNKIQNILSVLVQYSSVNSSTSLSLKSIHGLKIKKYIKRNQMIQIVLPAFPAKSPNNEKTTGILPDMAEVLALQTLNNICKEIATIYSKGAEVIICSDGRIFSDLVCVDDQQVNEYAKEIDNIIHKFNFSHLRTFNLEDVFPSLTFDEMRATATSEYGQKIEKIQEQVKSDSHTQTLFNGIHRFIFEDRLVLDKVNSKNNIRKYSKQIAYQVIQRSNAWSGIVEKHFSNAVRLSIHPHQLDSEKLGIQMLPCQDRWGTPWHNVAIFHGERFVLMKKKDALALGATEHCFKGKYTFFVAPEHVTKANEILQAV